jgi:hypothetical protein
MCKVPEQRSCFVITFTILIFFSSLLTSAGLSYIPQNANAQVKSSITTPPPSSSSPSTPPLTSSFQTYENPILGLKIQYPSNWLIKERPYNATGNSTIASFLSPPQVAPTTTTASPSGVVADRFVPYVDIFVFDSKNMSLDQLINGSVNHNISNSTISKSKQITLKGNNPAHIVEYSVMIADRYLFDRMQVWTKSGSKAFVISYTAEPQSYLTYLPTMQKMIQSLEIAGSPKTELTNSQQHPNASSSTSAAAASVPPPSSEGTSATGIPGLP